MPRLPAADSVVEAPVLPPVVREEPLLVAAILVIVAVALFGLALFLRWLRRPPGSRLLRVLSRPDAVTVLMHPNPDPDAMAAAVGVRRLVERAGTPVDVRYPGQIRHQENRAFRTVLNCDFEPIEDAGALGDREVILVDHNEPRGFAGCETVDPYAVIDHHPGAGSGSTFTDVRIDYGACASIVAEYFDDLGVEPVGPDGNGDGGEDDDGLPSPVATGLLYGILADTNHLTRGCSSAEFEASAYLYPGVDEDALDRIANPEVDAEVLDVKARAITERDVRGPFAVSHVGTVSNVDAVPQAADELLSLEGVTAVVVVGEKDDTLHLSGRSRDDRVHMGDALAAAVEAIPMSTAGGHARMGGGQVSIPHLRGLRPGSGMSREEFTAQLFDAMAGDL